jgi:hypothetical protein
LLWEPGLQKPWEGIEGAGADVAIEIREDVLDENLAPELLAEEADIAADDRAEIEQHGRLARREAGQEFPEGFGAENGIISRARLSLGTRVGLVFPRSEAI